MYWKKFVISFLFFLIMFAQQVHADEYQVDSGNIPQEYMDVLKNINIPFIADYVVFACDGDYILVYGDLDVEGKIINSFSECHRYTLSSDFTMLHDTIVDLQLNCEDYIVYSNLGDYPLMYERGVVYEATSLFILCICIGFILIMYIFKSWFR